ncbi:MFS general substrate transporter [Multifurca ochricompacta]|uniref:MFS general substrate transporter n=1 Tax=Multifurca ochricompacta TaxID=376703 RepID=A0AAD4M5C9_9AGAM|nr:MFS general substrate transporter [Multifurca ochricompacta]
MSSAGSGGDIDEETPFLRSNDVSQKPTPLPKAQFSIVLSVWLAESIVSNSISPYLNQLVRELPIVGGDGRKVGYYTGIIVALHYTLEVTTAIHWNRLSDHIGRRPVVLSCLMGTTISIIVFGLSRSFWAIVLSRCLHGAVKGNIGTVRSMVAELTDETNVARGFSLTPVTWALGYVIGSFVGGILSKPQDRWPHIFSHQFWADYPYFLPCLVAASYSCISFIIVAMYLKEAPLPKTGSGISQGEPGRIPDALPKDEDMLLPLSSILTRPVVISAASLAVITLFNTVADALIPLIWSTSIEFGGLGLVPASIGLLMSAYGCLSGIFQYALFPSLIRRYGPRNVFLSGVVGCAVIYVIFPLENLALQHGPKTAVWLMIALQLLSFCISEMGYSTCATYLYLSSAAPNKRSLGATNGFAQTVSSAQLVIGPAGADWLFAFSVTNNVLGGYLVYIVLLAFACIGPCVAAQLPRHTWRHDRT